ncbi:P-loop containing nucleoside triphosphate hydrolase protein [Aspergillus terricola var. indicus]
MANRVHIIEPPWNPSVEEQAIGRVLRLGQQKKVYVTRYIVKDSIEEYVQNKQSRKMNLAEIGWGGQSKECRKCWNYCRLLSKNRQVHNLPQIPSLYISDACCYSGEAVMKANIWDPYLRTMRTNSICFQRPQ